LLCRNACGFRKPGCINHYLRHFVHCRSILLLGENFRRDSRCSFRNCPAGTGAGVPRFFAHPHWPHRNGWPAQRIQSMLDETGIGPIWKEVARWPDDKARSTEGVQFSYFVNDLFFLDSSRAALGTPAWIYSLLLWRESHRPTTPATHHGLASFFHFSAHVCQLVGFIEEVDMSASLTSGFDFGDFPSRFGSLLSRPSVRFKRSRRIQLFYSEIQHPA